MHDGCLEMQLTLDRHLAASTSEVWHRFKGGTMGSQPPWRAAVARRVARHKYPSSRYDLTSVSVRASSTGLTVKACMFNVGESAEP